MLFDPFTINRVEFKNRVVRSSIGGKSSFFNGAIGPAFGLFESRFAERGIAAIVTATVTVDDRRWSPLEYPKISQDRFIKPFSEAVKRVHSHDCRYIIQIGDAGGHTQMSLLPEAEDSKSASWGFDLVFGYRNFSSPMSVAEIEQTVANFAEAARRGRDAGFDGVEITASKGYIIHQFLNPATNRRTDAYGGSLEKRFQFLREIVTAVRKKVGKDFLLGIRLSAIDSNYQPLNLRWPIVFPLKHYLTGNGLPENLYFAKELAKLGIDYLHMSNGFGFINPTESTGAWPVDEFRMYANATRHLSFKANARATLLNVLPRPVVKALFGIGWGFEPANNAAHARLFREATGIPVIANGGFERRDLIEEALQGGKCDLVSMARPLLANPNLLKYFAAGANEPPQPCTHCNRCSIITGVYPLGCYDRSRFTSQEEMEAQILWWSGGPTEAPPGSADGVRPAWEPALPPAP